MASNILAQMSVVLGAQTKEFEAAMSKARAELSGFKKMGENMSNFGSNITKYLTVPLAGLAAVSLKTAGDIQALQKGLIAVSGSAEAADKQFSSLKQVAKLPGLGLEEAIQGSINLQAAGFSAKQAEGALKGFGNALATVGKGKAELDGVITALSQMAAKGKISAEEINQIAERVPQIRKVMQQAFGTSNTEELQKMGISATQFVDLVTKELNKLPPVAGGLKNSFENLGDSGKLAMATLGDAINKNLGVEGFFNGLADKLTALSEGFQQLNPNVQRFIIVGGAIAAALGPVLVIFGGILAAIPSMVAGYTALKLATSGLAKQVVRLAVAYGPLVIQIAAITAAVTALALIGKSIYDAWDGIAAFFASLWAKVKLSFAESLLGIIQAVNKFGKFVGVEFKETEASLKSLAASAKANFDATPVVTFTDAISGVGQAITDNLNSGIAIVKDFFFQTSAGAKDAANEINKTKDALNNLAKGGVPRKAVTSAKTRGTAIDTGTAEKFEIPVQLKLSPIDPSVFKTQLTALEQHILNVEHAISEFSARVSALINEQIVGSFILMGESLGAALSGGNGFQHFFDGFISMMADFAGQLGKLLIAQAVALAGMSVSLKNPSMWPVALAAGVALVAASGAVRSFMSKGPGSASTPTAPRSASPNYGSPGMSAGYGGGKVQFEISGNSLVGVLDRETYRQKRFWN